MKTKEEIVDQLAFEKGFHNLPEFLKNATLGMIENLMYDAMDKFSFEVAKQALDNADEKMWNHASNCDLYLPSSFEAVILDEKNIPES